jgi:p-hydroxybenzoate 3-monooxygenase
VADGLGADLSPVLRVPLILSTMESRTQVGIIGAGPAGLMLAHLLGLRGIDSVILEVRDRGYVEHRVRAGVLEQNTVELLDRTGLSGRLHREALVHHGIEIRFRQHGHRIALSDLTGGRSITIYGQQELVKDLIAARLATGGLILFEAQDVGLHDLTSEAPRITYRHGGERHTLHCRVIVGCDGFHGISRAAIPAHLLTEYNHEFPFAWLGILADVAPSTDELIYAHHARGFALHSLRSPRISRLYLQVAPDEDLAAWPDERIWDELQVRLASDDGWALTTGPVLEKGIAGLRSFVVDPMRYGRLFLAGDAAHIVPATGAKGLNLAIADVYYLAAAIEAWESRGDARMVDDYSVRCLRRVWRVQDFSCGMSAMLHVDPTLGPFGYQRQLAQLDYLVGSTAAATSLAENYVGLPFDWFPLDGRRS